MSGSFLSIDELSDQELRALMARAQAFQMPRGQVRPHFEGHRSIAALFFEKSTRTRLSFEQAAMRLGVSFASIDIGHSSVGKGESIKKTIETVSASGYDVIILRHNGEGIATQCSRWSASAIINAGDGCHAHPTQALADALTLAESFGGIGGIAGKTVGIVGDVAHSRVARSTTSILGRLGAEVVWIGPESLLPRFGFSSVRRAGNLDDELDDLDVVYLLRVQFERLLPQEQFDRGRYVSAFQLNRQRLRKLKPSALVMHPGPMNVGTEVDSFVSDAPSMRANAQVTWGIYGRMAVIERAVRTSEVTW
jgi:aspartate carbamoyltransferase catalytic subunit